MPLRYRIPAPAPAGIVLFGVLAVLGLGCEWLSVRGSGVGATVRREVPEFRRVAVGGAIDLVVRVGAPRSVQLSGDDNLLPLVRTVVENGTLRIRPTRNLWPRRPLRAEVSTPTLDALSVSGSSNALVEGVRGEAFDVSVSGSGSVRGNAAVRDLTASVSGSGDVDLGGLAERIVASVSGSGSLDLFDVPATSARVEVSGSGDVAVTASRQLDARVSGSGSVRYGGKPTVRSRVSGSGTVSGV